ncbi:hypothetical protein SAMN05443550_102189 [Pedobacter hartonius]|uniref:Putative auto-transporter adhesin head GIN domain-containing protein n=2 Tax=Pedobacter hartonius TaxID=425514 RepID=A0A1H3Z1G1_9SPHI|nr:hypothetical protein SAMN05443550_102189 [Pedobacter hartonius]
MLSVAGTAKERFKAESADTVPDIKKITVKGNTVVYLVQSQKEQVTIDEGDPKNVSVKQFGNTLVISSDEKDPVIVTVYFKNIYRVDAYNTSTVLSNGKLKANNLQILLRDTAMAWIKTDTQSLYTVTDGHSKLALSGTAKEHILQTQDGSTLNSKHFIALVTKKVQNEEMIARRELSSSGSTSTIR